MAPRGGALEAQTPAAAGARPCAPAVLEALDAFVTGDRVHAHVHDFGRVLGFSGVEVLAIDRDGTLRARRHRVADLLELRAREALLGLPVHAVLDESVAARGRARRGIDAEGDAKLVLVQAHDERALAEGDRVGLRLRTLRTERGEGKEAQWLEFHHGVTGADCRKCQATVSPQARAGQTMNPRGSAKNRSCVAPPRRAHA